MTLRLTKMVHGRRVSRSEPSSRRSMVACNRCRNRKTKCGGRPPEPCAACVDVGESCVYLEAEKRVSITERWFVSVLSHTKCRLISCSYYRHLQSQARSCRNLESQPAPSVPPSVPESDPPDDWWYKGTDLFVKKSGEHRMYWSFWWNESP